MTFITAIRTEAEKRERHVLGCSISLVFKTEKMPVPFFYLFSHLTNPYKTINQRDSSKAASVADLPFDIK